MRLPDTIIDKGGIGAMQSRLKRTECDWSSDVCSSDLRSPLRDISFTDGMTGTAVGDFGAIVRTTDGGNHWIRQMSGTTDFLVAVSFSDANNGIAVGSTPSSLPSRSEERRVGKECRL